MYVRVWSSVSNKKIPSQRALHPREEVPVAVSRRDFLLGVAGVGAASGLAFAHDYPSRPIKWLVGYPAGGASDFLARVLAPKLQATVGQPFIVENRTGAAGIIAMEALAKSEADGYTIANTGNGELVFNQALYKKLPYDADKNFALIGTIAKIPLVLVVQPNMSVKNLAELIAAAKERPGALNYGSGGVGHPGRDGRVRGSSCPVEPCLDDGCVLVQPHHAG